MPQVTPLGALLRGLGAGIAGSAAIGAFFEVTGSLAPAAPREAFKPREAKQAKEQPTETIARRGWENFMKLGKLDKTTTRKAGQAVHFAFGAGWGAVYGLVRETVPALAGPLGAAVFGTIVWTASDHALLPAFGLAPVATKVPARNHAYFWAAHIVYGLATWASYETLRPHALADLATGAVALLRKPTLTSRMRAAVAPFTERVLPRVHRYASGLAEATT